MEAQICANLMGFIRMPFMRKPLEKTRRSWLEPIGKTMGKWWFSMGLNGIYPLVMSTVCELMMMAVETVSFPMNNGDFP